MSVSVAMEGVAQTYVDRFGSEPDVVASAPGRVNLLGEHTDYNGGFVLPIALRDLGVSVAAGRGTAPGRIDAYSDTFHEGEVRDIGDGPAGRWSDFIIGAARAVARDAVGEYGLRLAVSTNLPLGAGLSSSAALEVATIRALVALFGLDLAPEEIAVTARTVENDYVGMPCGIMDQFACSVGEPGKALFLDTRTLEYAPAPGLPGYRFVVLDSGVSHQLTDSGYATRVAECRAACAALGVALLSDLDSSDLDRIDAIAPPLNRRARHVVTDNRLAREGLAVLQAGDAPSFGKLMTESHATERDNFEITVPETDLLAEAAVEIGALGARQTGGGWGGSVVALVPTAEVEAWSTEIITRFPKARVLAVT